MIFKNFLNHADAQTVGNKNSFKTIHPPFLICRRISRMPQ